jgi:hypothetical protein
MTTDDPNATAGGLWDSHAVRWDLIGPPLRPAAEDLATVAGVVSSLASEHSERGLDVLMLGVAPEYARFPWPPGTNLVAREKSAAMVRHVWPGSTAETARVVLGNWLERPAEHEEFDLVLGDGVLSMLSFPNAYEDFCTIMRSMTRPGGRWVVRMYARPDVPEESERVLNEAREGRLVNINEFKLRLCMSMCTAENDYEIGVAEVWQVWDQARRRHSALANGWSPERTATIDNYRDMPVRYSFPTRELALETVRPFVEVQQVCFPTYDFGGSCPTVILRP